MRYSDRLNGYWEEGYHYYIEIRDEKITIRDYRRAVMLETTISYDADRLDRNEKTPITLENNVLSVNLTNEPMSMISEMTYENDELHIKVTYSYNDDQKEYILHKVDHGPFDHLKIRDDEYLEKLQGKWIQWGHTDNSLVIKDDVVTCFGSSNKFHVVSDLKSYQPDKAKIVPYDLTEDNFPGFTAIDIENDYLSTTMMVYDVSMPLSVFARKEMLDKIDVPEAARKAPVSTMMKQPDIAPMKPFMGMSQQNEDHPLNGERLTVCPDCGEKFEKETPRFCPGCGRKLK